MCFNDDVVRELGKSGPDYRGGDHAVSLEQAIRTGRAQRIDREFTIADGAGAEEFRINNTPDGILVLARATLRPTGTAALTAVVTCAVFQAIEPEVSATAKPSRGADRAAEPTIDDLVLANGSIAGDFSSTNYPDPGYALRRDKHLGFAISAPTGTGVTLVVSAWIVYPPRRN